MRLSLWTPVLLSVATVGGAADEIPAVVAQETSPIVDGVVVDGEYALHLDYGAMSVDLALVEDELFVAAAAVTAGWVAVGFGSELMDGARILFGFVEADSTVFFVEQVGEKHRHTDVPDTLVRVSAVTQLDGLTTLEAVLPVEFVRDSASESGVFPMIMATGRRDSVRTIHRFNKSVELTFG